MLTDYTWMHFVEMMLSVSMSIEPSTMSIEEGVCTLIEVREAKSAAWHTGCVLYRALVIEVSGCDKVVENSHGVTT